MRCATLVVTVALAIAMAACGKDEPAKRSGAGPGTIELTLRYGDGAGGDHGGTLTCTPTEQRRTGDLTRRAPAARLCDAARALKALLTVPPPAGRICARIYGGPQTGDVTGTIDGVHIDRAFTRTDGCRIKDFGRVLPILPAA